MEARNRSVICVVLTLCFVALLGLPALAEEYKGRIVGIADGDTVTLLTAQMEEIKIRLAGIDAPEKDQAFGQKSKQMLSDLVFNREVRVEKEDVDKYGRTVGHIYLGDIDINLLMISQGGAWAYRQYLGPKDQGFIAAEDAARKDRAGLWALQDDQIMPPWEWRHGGKEATAPAAVVCTMDAKLCPDGSSVSRTGSNCEFAACPETFAPSDPVTSYTAPAQSYSRPTAVPAAEGKTCCKHCSKGIPCGNGCISASQTCRKPPGCAC
jgi:endonuclease YncB( thermonuclease family)